MRSSCCVDHRAALRLPPVTHKQRAEEQCAADCRERYCPRTPRPDLDVTVAHGENESSADPLGADPVSSLSPAVALEEGGLIRRASGGCLLGRRTVELGGAFLSGFGQTREFYRVCEDSEVLRRQMVQIAMLDGARVLYLAVHEGRERFPLSANVGDRYPASVTAIGTARLSELTPAEVAQLYWDPSQLVGFTERSTTTLATLQSKLERTRKRGYATDEGEVHPPCSDSRSSSPAADPVNHLSASAFPSFTPSAPDRNGTPSSKPSAPPHESSPAHDC